MAQNDWKIGLLGGLDETKSRSQLNSDIKRLAKQLDKLEIYVELAPDQAKELRQQMKTLQIELNNITVSDAAINGLVNSINSKLKGIQIPNITIGGTGNNTLSRQLGDNTAKLNAFKDSLKNIGMADSDIDRVAKRIEQLGVQINSLGQSTLFKSGASGNREFLNVEIDGIDKFGQAVKLTEQWDLELGTLVKSIDAVSTAQEKASSRVDNFASKQKNAVASFQNTINQVLANALDSNSSKPITSDNSFKLLEGQIDKVELAMTELKSATAATFDDAKIKVQEEISNLKILEKQLKNADNIPTKLKGTNIDAGFDIASNDLEKFKSDAKDYPQIIATIEALDKALEGVGDAASLNKFNDELKVAKSELAKLKSETMSANRAEKVGINVSGLQSKITDLQKISPEIDNFETEINGAKVTVKSLTDELSKVNTQSDFSVVNTKWRAFTEAAKASGIAVRLIGDNSESSAHKVQKITEALDTGVYSAKVDSIVAKTQQWTDASGQARISTADLEAAWDRLAKADNDEDKITYARQLEAEIKKTTADIRSYNAEWAKDSQVSSLHQRVQEFYDKNSATHKKWGAQLKSILAQTGNGAKLTKQDLQKLSNEFINIGNSARQAEKLGRSFWDKLKSGIKTFTQWTSSTTIVMKVFQKFKEGTQFIRELDDALTDVAYTSNVSQAQLNNLGDASIKMSKDLKASAENVFEAVKIYSTANATADDILRKSKPAIMLSNVSGMSGSESAKTIQTSLNQFEIEDTEEGLLDIVDTLEYVSSQLNYDFTEGMKQITEGIEASGSVAKNAGLNMQEYSAMVGIAVEKTGQSGSTIGNAYKTILSRITKASEIEGTMAEDISKAEEALRGVDVQVRDSANNFRDMSDIMADIGEVWDGLTDTQKAKIGYEVAGIRQLNVLNSLFGAWDEYSSIMENIDDRAGTALKNQEEYADSLNGRIQELGATGKSIWNNIFDTRDFKNVVSMGTSLLGIIDDITGALGTWGTLGAGAGIFAAFKNVGRPKMYGLTNYCFELPTTIGVLTDTEVFLWSNVKYTR